MGKQGEIYNIKGKGETMLIFAVTAITGALVFYSIGVWGEKLQGRLRRWHLVCFWVGFACDTTGTTLMSKIAGDSFQLNFHGVTGALAIVLMLIHAVWATAVLLKKNPDRLKSFHKFSLFVWIVWLIPFLSGMLYGMMR
jgi:uncharacterized repeat protein (TIGR03987 family)